VDERLPCPNCGEPAALAAQMCPHCGASLLVDILLRSPVADSRVRYRVARALQTLPGSPPLSEIQAAFVGTPPAAARKVTRAFAHSALAVLAENGLKGSLESPKTARSGGSTGGGSTAIRNAMAAVGTLVILAMGYGAWRQVLSKPEGEEASAPAAAPKAAGRRPPAAAAPKAALSARELARRSLPSTVSLRCARSVGSGFFVAPDLVMTNHHVLCPAGDSIQVVTSDGRKFVGRTERSDENLDLGLVRVEGATATPLPLGDVADLAVGDKVMIIGSPIGLEFTVHEGSVSSLQRSAFGVAYVQLDAKINPGNSGGPMIDLSGRVVGVVSLKAMKAEGIGLALPINYAYTPPLEFVPPPDPRAVASEPFIRMVARAKEESAGETRQAKSGEGEPGELDDRPLLVAGFVDQYHRLVVRLVRVTDREPGFEEVTIKLWNRTELMCTVKGDVTTWKQVDPRAAGSGFDPQAGAALSELAEGRTFFVGESPLSWESCRRGGTELELVGANPVASRLTIR